MNKRVQKGSVVELRIIAELIERGYLPYLPALQSGAIDCIVDTKEGLKKIQIKIARRKHKKLLNYYAQIRSINQKVNYADLGIDFIICENDRKFFIVKKSEFENKTNYDLPINKFEGRWDSIPLPFETKKYRIKKESDQCVIEFGRVIRSP